ncbi:MAG: response regulator [Calditrichaceae bacterium]|nr:response regulator [Calditrichaceae bacterium]MBN2709478.1 response regulator [Calditrichaceae bacterium]RQV94803.1 MAG: response regulator [Calditrichota bacterium]
MKQQKKRICFILYLILAIVNPGLSEVVIDQVSNPVHFQHHAISSAGQKNAIIRIMQDSFGFLWVASKSSVYRYDGYSFNKYYEKDISHYKKTESVEYLYEDPEIPTHIWLALSDRVDVINWMPVNTESDIKENKVIKSYDIKSVIKIIKDKYERVWFKQSNHSIYLLDGKTNQPVKVVGSQDSIKAIVDIFEHPVMNDIFIVNYKGHIYQYNEQSKAFNLFIKLSYDIRCNSTFLDQSSGLFWVGSGSGNFVKVNLITGEQKFIHFKIPEESKPNKLNDIKIYVDNTGIVWLGTENYGLIEYDPFQDSYEHHRYEPNHQSSIHSNSIHEIFEDKTGLMWIGYDDGYISQFKKRQSGIYSYKYYMKSVALEYESTGVAHVFSFSRGAADDIYLGSTHGLFILRKNPVNNGFYIHHRINKKDLSSISVIERDHERVLWLGTFGHGIWQINEKNDRIELFSPSEEWQRINGVFDILADSDDEIWIATTSKGIIRYNKKTRKTLVYSNQSGYIPFPINFAYCILEPKPGIIWFGSASGIYSFNKKTNSFEKRYYPDQKKGSLSGKSVSCMLKTKNGKIYVGTNNGLNILNPDDSTFSYYDKENGLADIRISGILEDLNGNIWVSTRTGISKFDIERSYFINFDIKDGLYKTRFYMNSCFVDHNGWLFFGSQGGITVIDPDKVKKRNVPPMLVITNYQSYKESVIIGENELKNPLLSSCAYEYNYRNNIFHIEFSALDFTNPYRNRYRYRMEGIDDAWHDLENNNSVTFVNLPPENYRFSVQGANDEGLWNEKPFEIIISISPPFWQTIWFWVLSLFVAMAIIYLVYHLRLQQVKKRNIKLEKINKELTEQISIREKMENMLRESEEKYRTLVSSIKQEIFTCDIDGKVYFVNDIIAERLNKNRYDLIGENISVLYSNYDMGTISRHINTVFSRRKGVEFNLYSCSDYFPDCLHFSFQPLATEKNNKDLILGIATDLTEQKKLEEQLRQSQKMEAIGKLAGGIAHDFNNLIAVIRGYSDLIMSDIEKDTEAYENILEIDKAGERAAILVRQLLAFSRRQMLEPQVLNLNELIRNMEKMLSRLIPENIEMWIHLDPKLNTIFADPGQIEQVIINLFVNAKDAINGNGKLSIRTRNSVLQKNMQSQYPYITSGNYVLLEISDNGCGIPAEIKEKIFEPFFTTKEKGEGTGLGLSTVFGIVKQSNGYIFADSTPGKGSKFSVYLPKTEIRLEEDRPSLKKESRKGSGETILVVEDEPGLKKMIVKMLTSRNYNVITGSDGLNALKVSREYQGIIHLLLTDIVMPGMSGRELAEIIQQERTGIKTLYMSGYTDDQILQKKILQPGVQYIQKPFTPMFLSEKIRDILKRDHTHPELVKPAVKV